MLDDTAGKWYCSLLKMMMVLMIIFFYYLGFIALYAVWDMMVDIKPGKCKKREWEQNDWGRLRP